MSPNKEQTCCLVHGVGIINILLTKVGSSILPCLSAYPEKVISLNEIKHLDVQTFN